MKKRKTPVRGGRPGSRGGRRNKLVYWTPRILIILFAVFISIFALDVFEEYQGAELFLALFMHLIPTFVILILLAIAWRWEKVGGWLFIALGIISIFFFNTWRDPIVFLIISFPVIIIGILFLLSEKVNKKKK